MVSSIRPTQSLSDFQLVSLPGQSTEINDDEACGICLDKKDLSEMQTLPHNNYDPDDPTQRCSAQEQRLYCRACVAQLPSPKKCPQCRASIITEIAVQNIPETAAPQTSNIENVVVIHNPLPQLEEEQDGCILVENIRYLWQTGQWKWFCLPYCVIVGVGLIALAILGSHGYLKT
jgi:hypothetical protein